MEDKTRYVGLDMGTKWIYGTIISGGPELRIVKEAKFPCTIDAVERFLGGTPKEYLNVAMEACGIFADLYDHLCGRCSVVKMTNPLQTHWIGNSRRKTDRIDSRKLAMLLKSGSIIESYVPSKDARLARRRIRHRQGFVTMKTALKNRVYAVIRQDNISVPGYVEKDVFTKKGMSWLKTLGNQEIDDCTKYIPDLGQTVTDITKTVSTGKFRAQIELLKTMPGVGDVTASVVMSEIDEVERFATAKKLCAYSGLVASIYQSGNVERRGRITKQGSRFLRAALNQAAWSAVRQECRFKRFFERLVERGKTTNKAIVAVERKMLQIMWIMLTKNQPYVDAA